MADPALPTCTNCGRAQLPDEVQFRRCSRCVEEKLVAAVYCSKECQKENWPAHKAWHCGVKDLLHMAEEDEYGNLLKLGLRECAQDNSSEGIKAFMRAILLKPTQPAAYANLGYSLRDKGDFRAAVPQLLRAVELFGDDTEQWATTTAVTWFTWANPGNEGLEVPSWMQTLSERVAMAERCVAAAPGSMQVQAMLGLALAEEAVDPGRAAQALMRAAKLTDQPATRDGYLKLAKSLLQELRSAQREPS